MKLTGQFLKVSFKYFSFSVFFAAIALTFASAVAVSAADEKVDPNFDVRVQTNSYSTKSVDMLNVLPDGKILASGAFNTYNGQPVGGLIRINADGSLDATFNNNLLAAFTSMQTLVQSDGKIIIAGNFRLNGQVAATVSVLRLDSKGENDPSFSFASAGAPRQMAFDASGRIIFSGFFQVTENGVAVSRSLIRLNADGTHDPTFRYQANRSIEAMTTQNNKIVVGTLESLNNTAQATVSRINEDGSTDNSFVPTVVGNVFFRDIAAQPDNKIIAMTDRKLLRLNQNGGEDAGFQTTSFSMQPKKIFLTADGKISTVYGDSPGNYKVIRVLPNGAPDPAYNIYTYTITHVGGTAMAPDGSVLIGDSSPGFGTPIGGNGFVRVLPTGFADSSFNAGGAGFLNVNPGSIRAIAVQADDKILIGGKFDTVNGALRNKIARLNADATLDTSFNVNTTPNGNYFSVLNDIYTAGIQADGKIVLTGNFNYFVGGVQRFNMVRLNADGSIDASFNFAVNLSDYFGSSNGGQNRFAFQADGKIFLGMSRGGSPGTTPAIRLNANGTVDNSFSATVYNDRNLVYIMDAAIQPDGKILISGRYRTEAVGSTPSVQRSFLIRLNNNGSRDETFQVPDDEEKTIKVFKLLSDGKIIAAQEAFVSDTARQTVVRRYNADGSLDASFAAGIGANGVIDALTVLPDGKIMVGGKFAAFNDQPRANLAKLNADGSLNDTVYAVNQEVLSLTLDNQGRVLVGGSFTTISTGDGQNVSRAFAARLISSAESSAHVRFDFDGDGRADFAVFNRETGNWAVRGSGSSQMNGKFGASGDVPAVADFDGDGKSDRAVYRPSEGNWYILQSTLGFKAIHWGAAEDKPVAGDFDGDRQADIAVWRPSSGVWYILSSRTNQLIAAQFGQNGDIPLAGIDFDGDKRGDIAVFRPSNGVFYWLASGSNNQFRAVQFGSNGDVPAAADYNGDGKADLVVFRPSNGIWYQYLTTPTGEYTFAAAGFGQSGDVPVPADYNGDGKADIAVRRGAVWHLSLPNQSYQAVTFGDANAQAVAAMSVQ